MFEGLRFKHWRHELGADGILLLTLDRAGESANSLSREVLEELGRLVERIGIEPPLTDSVVPRSAMPVTSG